MSDKQWSFICEGGLNEGEHISGFLCCTSCVPEGKHVGQKDDTRENSCVTVRERGKQIEEEEGGGGEAVERKEKEGRKEEGGEMTGRKTERDWLDRKRKATHISVF